MVERVIVFGDTSGMTETDISSFVAAADCSYGGSYCGPLERRARQILDACNQHRIQKGEGQYVVVDSEPLALAEVTKAVATNGHGFQTDILRSVTVIQLGAQQGLDRVDPATGLRIALLPRPLFAFPTHPTPAS